MKQQQDMYRRFNPATRMFSSTSTMATMQQTIEQHPTIVEEESRFSNQTSSDITADQQIMPQKLASSPQQTAQKSYTNTGRRRSKSHPSILSETKDLQSLHQYPLLSDSILATSLAVTNDALSIHSSSSSSSMYRKRRKTFNNKID